MRRWESSLRTLKVITIAAIMVLSHWPHVAEQVQQQVAELVSKSFHKTAARAATSLRALAASSIFSTYNDITKVVHCVVESHGYSLQPTVYK